MSQKRFSLSESEEPLGDCSPKCRKMDSAPDEFSPLFHCRDWVEKEFPLRCAKNDVLFLRHVLMANPDNLIQTLTCRYLAEANHEETLKWLYASGVQLCPETFEGALKNCNWTLAQWCVLQGCPVSTNIVLRTVQQPLAPLALFQSFHTQNVVQNLGAYALELAVEGRLDVLQDAHAKGLQLWKPDIRNRAFSPIAYYTAICGKFDVLQWLWSHGHLLNENYFFLIRTFNCPEIVRWLKQTVGLSPPLQLLLDEEVSLSNWTEMYCDLDLKSKVSVFYRFDCIYVRRRAMLPAEPGLLIRCVKERPEHTTPAEIQFLSNLRSTVDSVVHCTDITNVIYSFL